VTGSGVSAHVGRQPITSTITIAMATAMVLGGCGRKARDPVRETEPERLHPPGELRLVAAGEEPRVALRYRLVAGSRSAYRTRVTVKHVAEGQRAQLATLLEWERTIGEVKPDGAAVKLAVTHVLLARPESGKDAMAESLRQLVFELRMDARGRVIGQPVGPELPGQEALSRLTAPLPGPAVGEGATWERFEPLDLTLPHSRHPVQLGTRTTYHLAFVRRKGKSLRARITGKISLTVRSNAQANHTGYTISGGGQGSSTMMLDLQRGEVTESESEVKLALELKGYGRDSTFEQTTTVSTRSVKPSSSRK
jgi:hypothetical protein